MIINEHWQSSWDTAIEFPSLWANQPVVPDSHATRTNNLVRTADKQNQQPIAGSLGLWGSALTSPNAVWDFKRVGPMSSWVSCQPVYGTLGATGARRTSAICGQQRIAHVRWIGLDCQRELWMTDGHGHVLPHFFSMGSNCARGGSGLNKKCDVYRWACHIDFMAQNARR